MDIASATGEMNHLCVAATERWLPVVRTLIDLGADAKLVEHGGWTSLHTLATGYYFRGFGGAAARGRDHAGIAALLLERGALVNAIDEEESVTPLHVAAYNYATDVMRVLLERGADVNAVNVFFGRTPLISTSAALPMGYVMNIKAATVIMATMLLDRGADVNARDLEGMTARGRARDAGNAGLVKLLTARGGVV